MDNNGFIIISEQSSHTGKFFGQIDGTIMDSLVQDKIYKRISVVDNQGFCSDSNNPFTAAATNTRARWILPSLFKYVVRMFFTILTLASKPISSWPQEDYIYNDEMFEPEYTDEYEPFDYIPEVIADFTPTSETLVNISCSYITIYFNGMIYFLRNSLHSHQRNQKCLMILKLRLI